MMHPVPSRVNTAVGAVVVRAWVEPEAGPKGLRARVLAITGHEADMQEVGVAAGLSAILELVEEALRTVVPIGDAPDRN
jgi:hypothetical protein